MGDTAISWTDKTWNCIRGCSRISEGCRHCYAERVAARFSGPGQPYEGLAERRGSGTGLPRWTGDVRFVAQRLAAPLHWRNPRRIFVNSMSDLFHDNLTNEQIAAIFGVMSACPQHTFQCLTKRARRMREWFDWIASQESDPHTECHGAALALDVDDTIHTKSANAKSRPWPLPNVWLGVSCENQDTADERIPDLLATPAAVRWISAEPLLGGMNIAGWIHRCSSCVCSTCPPEHDIAVCNWTCDQNASLHWVVAGCESGPGARRCEVSWLRSLRDQCKASGVPFWLKQARQEEYPIRALTAHDDLDRRGAITEGEGSKRKAGGVIELPYLDGVQHKAFPA